MKKLLLVSNSTLHGSGYLDHCSSEIQNFLGKGIKKVLFIPFARPGGISYDAYTAKAKERFLSMGFELSGVHEHIDVRNAVAKADSIFIGGGNTFVLLKGLYEFGILESIRSKVLSGTPYIGTSAGSNVACPTIMTTNDMPVAELDSFRALDLVPFQINAHYIDSDPNTKHMGETRETRINEFHVFNNRTVIGLREGNMILVEDDEYTLKGTTGARIFNSGKEPIECKPICSLNDCIV